MDDDLRRLREEFEVHKQAIENAKNNPQIGTGSFVGIPYKQTTYPLSINVYFMVMPQIVGGAEVEGSAATITPMSGVDGVPVLNLGTTRPTENTSVVICTYTKDRFVMTFNG